MTSALPSQDQPPSLSAEDVEALFVRGDGRYAFARWGRPIAPVIFGVDDATLTIFKGAIEAIAQLASHPVDEVDTELGANLLMFFCKDWSELREIPNLDRLILGFSDLLAQLDRTDANQYRVFRFGEAGAIRACFVLIRMDESLASISAETFALNQAVQLILLWSDKAFLETSPLGMVGSDRVILKPEIASVIRAAYDPVMPAASNDVSHALRLQARMTRPQ
ncbi:hypothetical protein AAD018_016205 [Aestuariibius insulae]|uniref:hypothetical protein n=1 Tax=Aestuariibius insulae TaxID=2058287 RepID=UPI00345E6455